MNNAVRNISPLHITPVRLSIIILAASSSPKMKSFGIRSLLPINNKQTIIEYQLSQIQQFLPGAEVVLVTGFESDKLMNKTPHGLIKVENEQFEEVETVRNLGLGLRATTRDYVTVLNGETIFNKDFIKGFNITKSSVIIDPGINPNSSAVGCTAQENKVEQLMFDLPNRWCDIATFCGKELELLRTFCWNKQKGNLFIFEAINHIVDRGGTMLCQTPVGMKVHSILAPSDIEKASEVCR